MDFNGRSGEMVVFATVAEEGSLSAAARALGLTPSAVSRIIARTEQRLGTRLLLRTTRAITFTAEGDVLDIDIPKERRDENGLLVLVKEHDALQVAVTEARNFLEARRAVFGK